MIHHPTQRYFATQTGGAGIEPTPTERWAPSVLSFKKIQICFLCQLKIRLQEWNGLKINHFNVFNQTIYLLEKIKPLKKPKYCQGLISDNFTCFYFYFYAVFPTIFNLCHSLSVSWIIFVIITPYNINLLICFACD